eukprot:256115-Pelagomonas_calceolata.AAC.2
MDKCVSLHGCVHVGGGGTRERRKAHARMCPTCTADNERGHICCFCSSKWLKCPISCGKAWLQLVTMGFDLQP